MRSLLAALTAAIGFIGCGGEPQQLTTFEVDRDGKPVPGTVKQVELEAGIDRQQFALLSGVGYTWDCQNEAASVIYGGEVKLFRHFNNYVWPGHATAKCRGFGLGGNNVMANGLDNWSWPGTFDIMSNVRAKSARFKISDATGGTHHGDNKYYRNLVLGGGCAEWQTPSIDKQACFGQLAPGTDFWFNFDWDPARQPGSFDLVRRCGPEGTPQAVCP